MGVFSTRYELFEDIMTSSGAAYISDEEEGEESGGAGGQSGFTG